MNPRPVLLRAATAADDAGLRALARETPVSGAVRVALEREPFYAAGDPLATRIDTVVAEWGGRLVGCGSRVVRSGWWNGRVQSIAYLTGLRVHPSHQRRVGRSLRSGFGWIESMAGEPTVSATWTAIFTENREALKVLTGSRAGMPSYLDRGRLACRLWPARRRGGMSAPPAGTITTGSSKDVPAMIEFRNRWIVGRPLAMPLEASCFESTDGFPGLRPEDFLLWCKNGEVLGMLCIWDMRAVRQIRILETPGWWRWIRVPARWAARISGWPELPSVDDVLAVGYTSFFSVREDERKGAAALLAAARRVAGGRGLEFLCVCLHESDPLVALGDAGRGISADGRLYEVVAPGGNPCWTSGVPVIEPALL